MCGYELMCLKTRGDRLQGQRFTAQDVRGTGRHSWASRNPGTPGPLKAARATSQKEPGHPMETYNTHSAIRPDTRGPARRPQANDGRVLSVGRLTPNNREL